MSEVYQTMNQKKKNNNNQQGELESSQAQQDMSTNHVKLALG